MDIPNNITKAHIEKAIEKIDKEGVPSGAHSTTYDVVFKNKKYPPKLLISYANLFANGSILDRGTFKGGLHTPCFNLLKTNGFVIQEKKENLKNKVWIEKTIVRGRKDRLDGERALGKVLWSPKQAKNGADIYKNMRDVIPGDVIIHLVDNEIFHGVSIAKKSAQDAQGIRDTSWNTESYLIPLGGYEELNPPLHRAEVLTEKNKQLLFNIAGLSEVFYTKDLNLRQGAYLTPCTPELLDYINSIYKKKSGKNLPYIDVTKEFEQTPSLQSNEIKEEFIKVSDKIEMEKELLKTATFVEDSQAGGLQFSKKLVDRFVSSLCTKPFVILTGLSGSGKTKLAQAFAAWICEKENQYCIVPVGADWTNREPLLGYSNALEQNEYVKPENGILDLLIAAKITPQRPFFIILDEMNLSHVERYFADFLSIMETGEDIVLFKDFEEKNGVPANISWPKNVFIVGTVNIDETTYMFSPKVLDRANTIEFRITIDEMTDFLKSNGKPDLSNLKSKGETMAFDFLRISSNNGFEKPRNSVNETLLNFFTELKKTGAEFGYRSATEIHHLLHNLSVINEDMEEDEKIDIAIMQKLLPKLHGSRRKLVPVLNTLGQFCLTSAIEGIEKEVFLKNGFSFTDKEVVKYPLSLEKLSRMYNGVIENGFASYAEA